MATEFDDNLRQRLLAFQEHHGLTGDGVAGTETWNKLVGTPPVGGRTDAAQHTDTGHHAGATTGAAAGAGAGAGAGAAGRGGSGGGSGTDTCGCVVEEGRGGGQAAAGAEAAGSDEEDPELIGVIEEGEEGEEEEPADDEGQVELQARGGRGRKRRRRPSGTTSVPAGCRTTAKACFSVSQRTAWLLRNGKVVVAVPALGGRSGHLTPTGRFSVQFHDKDHVSSIYHAPMPFYVNFAPAIGFHAGSLRVRSHGCVHLSRDNASRFFDYLKRGDHVDVVP